MVQRLLASTASPDLRQGRRRRPTSPRPRFRNVLLLVCALGARFSDDPRVLLTGYDDWHSAGWHWYHQASSAFQLVNYTPPRLYDLQIACVSAATSNSVRKLKFFGAYISFPAWIVFSVHVLAGSGCGTSFCDCAWRTQAQDIRCWPVGPSRTDETRILVSLYSPIHRLC